MPRLIESVSLIGQAGDRLDLSVGAPDTEGWVLGAPSTGALEGWWEPPAPRVESVARPQADGAFAPYQLLVGARIVTITIHHVTKDAASEARARALIARLCRGWLRLVVVEAGRVSHVNGFVSAQVKAHHIAGVASTWSIVMTCPDPLKYEGDGGVLTVPWKAGSPCQASGRSKGREDSSSTCSIRLRVMMSRRRCQQPCCSQEACRRR